MRRINHCDGIPAAQGDLLLVPVASVPSGYVRDESTTAHTLSHSETGHDHVLVAAEADVYRKPDDGMIAYMILRGPAQIEHRRPFDQHETLELYRDGEPEIGETVWEIRRQREYVPDGWRRVED